jgi:hypothetical protein
MTKTGYKSVKIHVKIHNMAKPKTSADCMVELKITSPREDERYERQIRVSAAEAKAVRDALTDAMRKMLRSRKPNGMR